MSVGHSRRTSRKPSPHQLRARCERLLQVRLDAPSPGVGVVVHRVLGIRDHLRDPDLEPIVALELAHDHQPGSSSITVGGVIQFNGL